MRPAILGRFLLIMALASTASAGSFPRMGVVVPASVIPEGSGREVVATVFDVHDEEGVLREELVAEIVLQPVAAGSRDHDRFVAPHAHRTDLGFVWNGRYFWNRGNMVEFWIRETSGGRLPLQNGTVHGGFRVYGEGAARTQVKAGYGAPTGNAFIGAYLRLENPAVNLGYPQDSH